MGLVLVLLETVMDPVGLYTGNWSPSIGGLLKPINPDAIYPKTHYRKPFFKIILMVKSWWFVTVCVVETIKMFCDGFIVFSVGLNVWCTFLINILTHIWKGKYFLLMLYVDYII